jgi:uncharacterized DUF497 family protein
MSEIRGFLPEIGSVFSARALILNDEANSENEEGFRTIGVTKGGQYAFVIFTMRGKLLRPFSARYMHKREIYR